MRLEGEPPKKETTISNVRNQRWSNAQAGWNQLNNHQTPEVLDSRSSVCCVDISNKQKVLNMIDYYHSAERLRQCRQRANATHVNNRMAFFGEFTKWYCVQRRFSGPHSKLRDRTNSVENYWLYSVVGTSVVHDQERQTTPTVYGTA